MATYKYESAQDWLLKTIDGLAGEGRVTELARMAREMGLSLDADAIEDLFQAEMDADGYFTPEED